MNEWQNTVNDNYCTLDSKKINGHQLKMLINVFVYSLPKKFSNKKEVVAEIKEGLCPTPKAATLNDYIDGLDESRLEELVGLLQDAVDDWDGIE